MMSPPKANQEVTTFHCNLVLFTCNQEKQQNDYHEVVIVSGIVCHFCAELQYILGIL